MSLGEPLSPPLLTSRPHLQLHLVITGDDGTVESSAVCQHTPTVTPAPLARTGALLPLRVVRSSSSQEDLSRFGEVPPHPTTLYIKLRVRRS